MLQTLQEEQQESLLMSHHVVLQTQMQLQGEIDSCAGTQAVAQTLGSPPGGVPDPPSPEAQHTPLQAASAPPLSTSVSVAAADEAARLTAAAAAAQAAESVSNPAVSAKSAAEQTCCLDVNQASIQTPTQALTQVPTQATLPVPVAVSAQFTSLPPPLSPCSESTAQPQQQAQALPATSAAVLAAASLLPGSAGMPAFTPQAFYLIPASAYGHGALPMLVPAAAAAAAAAVPQHAPHLTFVPEQQQSPAALEAQMPAQTPNQHMCEHPQQGGMQGGDPLEPQGDREVILAAVQQQGSEPDAKTRPNVGSGLEGGKQCCQRLLHVANSLGCDPMSVMLYGVYCALQTCDLRGKS